MSESLVIWGIGLLGVAGALLVLEMFIPSAGALGLIAGVTTIASLICFWRVSTMWGLASTLAVIVLIPIIVAFFLKVWPETPVGRRLILGGDDESEAALLAIEQGRQSERERWSALLNAEGVAITDLHPVGTVRIGDEKHEGLAQGGFIDAGEAIHVVGVEGTSLKIRRSS